ncbi:hemolysin family protein [Roseburia hominis]
MDEGSSLLQKMRRVFSDNEDKERIAEEIIDKVEEGYQKGVLAKREMKMICNIFGYMDEDAKDIMTHRKNVVALDGTSTLSEALNFILEENHSRLPVYEGDIDNIIGRIHLRDAMKCYFNESLRNVPIKELKEFLRPVSFVPETRSIDKLFQQMQHNRSHMAVVIDEYGQTAGIVTMEDIIEEIVGNIQDEYDEEEELIVRQSDGTYLVDGMTQLEDLEELLDVNFEEEDYDTLNGYLVDRLDRIPSEDEKCTVQFEDYVFQVLSVDNNTIRKVRIIRN